MSKFLKAWWLVIVTAPCLLLGAVVYTNVALLHVTNPNVSGGFPTIYRNYGAYLGWNATGVGETDLINQDNGAAGGFNFYNIVPNSVLGSPVITFGGNGAGTFNGAVTSPSIATGFLGDTGNASITGILSAGSLSATGATPGSLSQGAYLGWNMNGTSTGETDFINDHGGGTGGFYWFDNGGTAPGSQLMTLTPTSGGQLTIGGGGIITSANVQAGALIAPTAVISGASTLNGISNSGTTQFAETTSVCTTGSSANSTCTFTITWPTAFPSTAYHAVCTGISPSQSTGTPYLVGITAKATGTMTLQISNGQASAALASTFGAVDCFGSL